MENTIKQQLLEAGMTEEQLDTHESDLYVLQNDISMGWLESYEFKGTVTTFRSQIDNQIWYDIPFGYANEHYEARRQPVQKIEDPIISLSASEVDEAITSLEALGYYRLDDEEREKALYNENGLMPKESELLEKLSAAYQAHKNQGGFN